MYYTHQVAMHTHKNLPIFAHFKEFHSADIIMFFPKWALCIDRTQNQGLGAEFIYIRKKGLHFFPII